MLKLDSLHPTARGLLEGSACALSRRVPLAQRGARTAQCPVSSVLFRTPLSFDRPVTIASIGLWGDPQELRSATLVLELTGLDQLLQLALDLTERRFARFLMPMEMVSHQRYELYL